MSGTPDYQAWRASKNAKRAAMLQESAAQERAHISARIAAAVQKRESQPDRAAEWDAEIARLTAVMERLP